MDAAVTFDPLKPVTCPRCGWCGYTGDAVYRTVDVVCCPRCDQPITVARDDDREAVSA